MATRTKRAATPKARPAPARKAKAPAQAPQPFLRFHHSTALREKTLRLLGQLEQAEDATRHRDALADLVGELTNAGLDYYFMRPLKLAKAGFIVEQSAGIGMAGAQKVMATVARQIIGRMESPQLLSVCGSIRELMR